MSRLSRLTRPQAAVNSGMGGIGSNGGSTGDVGRTIARAFRLARLAAIAVIALLIWGARTESQAVPAFARQAGIPCTDCHFQGFFPALNAYGRSFKAAGYTKVGTEGLITGDGLSLPVTLNAALITKFRYQKTNGPDLTEPTNTGELQFPDEAALLIGGRAGEHIGFLLEMPLMGEANTGSGTVTGTTAAAGQPIAATADTGNGEFSLFPNFKIVFSYPVGRFNFSFIPFTTDDAGAGYGFELLNTGALRSQRVGEDRTALSAQQFVGLGAGTAQGFALVMSHDSFFINYTAWAPHHGTYSPKSLANYVRAAWMVNLGSWDTAIGAQYYTGGASENIVIDDPANPGTPIHTTETQTTSGTAVDFQMQGAVGSMPLGVYAAWATAPVVKGANPNLFNPDGTKARTAMSVHAQLGVIANKATVILGYRSGETGADTKNQDVATTVGGSYQIAQNVQLQLNLVQFGGSAYEKDAAGNLPAKGDQRATLMLFSAF